MNPTQRETPDRRVSQIWVYPIKGCRGAMLQESEVGIHGLASDRRYMVIDAKTGMFVAQRSDKGLGVGIRELCKIVPTMESEYTLRLSAPDMPDGIFYPFSMNSSNTTTRKAQVWKTECDVLVADDDTNHWLTTFLSRHQPGQYQLVVMHPNFIRRAKVGPSQLHFADGYPFLVISEESLANLNTKIEKNGGEPVPMDRFRPNIVFKGGWAYDEDRMDRVVINGVEFEGRELCVRCPVTMTDQMTTAMGKEPLRTLATYRRPGPGSGVVFGRNYNHLATGVIRIGDPVTHPDYH